MDRTRTELLIDDVAMWSSLAVYLAIWSAFLSRGFKDDLLIPALGVSGLYVGMHIYEITVRHHCYLSADSTAFPVTLLVSVAASGVAHFTSGVPWRHIAGFFASGPVAFLVGHIAALTYSALLGWLAGRCLRQRIASERAQSALDKS
jgi:hypothetical protein